MKLITILLLTFVCVQAAQQPVVIATVPKALPEPKKVEHLEQKYTPKVKLFIARCLDDEEHKFVNAQTWLKRMDVAQPDRDQMWEIISGLVWNIDRQRARTLALEIKNPEKQKAVLRHYDGMEQLPQPPVKKD